MPDAELQPALPAKGDIDLIAMYVQSGRPIAEAKELFDFVKQVRAEQAAALYHTAMVRAQAEMPVVIHDAENKHLKSSYAKLETIQHTTKPIYTKHGFSLSFGEEPIDKPGLVRVVCDVMHEGGHTKRYQGDYPMDGKGAQGGSNMNALQGRVSSNTYAQKDLLRSIFNLTVSGRDIDGESPHATLTADQIGVLNDLVDRNKDNKVKFSLADFLGIFGRTGDDADLGMLLASDFWSAFRILNKRIPETQKDEKLARLDEAKVRSYLEDRRK